MSYWENSTYPCLAFDVPLIQTEIALRLKLSSTGLPGERRFCLYHGIDLHEL